VRIKSRLDEEDGGHLLTVLLDRPLLDNREAVA
jgi:hypothetical protein